MARGGTIRPVSLPRLAEGGFGGDFARTGLFAALCTLTSESNFTV